MDIIIVSAGLLVAGGAGWMVAEWLIRRLPPVDRGGDVPWADTEPFTRVSQASNGDRPLDRG